MKPTFFAPILLLFGLLCFSPRAQAEDKLECPAGAEEIARCTNNEPSGEMIDVFRATLLCRKDGAYSHLFQAEQDGTVQISEPKDAMLDPTPRELKKYFSTRYYPRLLHDHGAPLMAFTKNFAQSLMIMKYARQTLVRKFKCTSSDGSGQAPTKTLELKCPKDTTEVVTCHNSLPAAGPEFHYLASLLCKGDSGYKYVIKTQEDGLETVMPALDADVTFTPQSMHKTVPPHQFPKLIESRSQDDPGQKNARPLMATSDDFKIGYALFPAEEEGDYQKIALSCFPK